MEKTGFHRERSAFLAAGTRALMRSPLSGLLIINAVTGLIGAISEAT